MRSLTLTTRRAKTLEGMAKVGRNEPCPCGSGKKYKQCHERIDQETTTDSARAMTLHELDRRLVDRMAAFARKHFGSGWLEELLALLELDDEQAEGQLQLLVPCALYEWEPDHGRLVERFLESSARTLSERERGWLEAQRRSWLSVWEVLSVDIGMAVLVRDVFTGEERQVLEKSGSRTLAPRDGLLGRVVDFEGLSLFCGTHPRTLPPRETAEFVGHVRKVARLGAKPCSPERLREKVPFDTFAIVWDVAVDEYDASLARPPRLQNTDGDPLLLTKDLFAFAANHRLEIETRLAALAELDDGEPGTKGERAYVFQRSGNAMHKSWDNTIVGRAVVRATELLVETNSIRRADTLRAELETALASLIRHVIREHEDPEVLMREATRKRRGSSAKPATAERHSEEEIAVLRDFKERHLEGWLDTPLPALAGLTPRQAAAKPRKRKDVELLLKELENHEARVPIAERVDLSKLWNELGIEP